MVGSRKSRFPGPNHYSWTMLNTFNSASFIPFFFCCKYEARFRLIVSIEWLDKISRMIMFDEVYFSYGVFFSLSCHRQEVVDVGGALLLSIKRREKDGAN